MESSKNIKNTFVPWMLNMQTLIVLMIDPLEAQLLYHREIQTRDISSEV